MTTWERRLWWIAWPVLTAAAIAGEVIQARSGSARIDALEFAGGYAFVVAGLVAWRRRPDNHLGRLMTLVGAVWFIGPFEDAHVAVVPSLGAAFRGFVPVAIAYLALAYPRGRLTDRIDRVVVVAGFATLGAMSLVVLATWNPRRDTGCQCPASPFSFVQDQPLLQRMYDGKDYVAGVVVLVTVVLIVRRLVRANVTQRWLLTPLWIATAVAGATFSVRVVTNVVSLSDSASGRVDDVLNVITMLIPLSFLIGLLRMRLEASPFGDLVVALGGPSTGETMQRALARTLHDPTVELAYWMPDRDGYVDAAGHAMAMPAHDGTRAVTMIERDGQRLAAIVHDPALLENPRLIEAATAAAGLALDNERLAAELRVQIEEVRASRTRIVEASDEARRRIERDLHDGAQQRLLATALALRMAKDEVDDDKRAYKILNDSADEMMEVLTDLRDLAHGIHPAILTERGIGPAIGILVERAPIPVLVDVPDERFPAAVESTAYFTVSEALANVVKHECATRTVVRVARANSHLVVEVEDDGVGGASAEGGSGLRGLADRVAALDGKLAVMTSPGGGTTLRAELPLPAVSPER